MHEIPTVIYAAKSTPDEKGSTADQLAQVRRRVVELGGREVVGEFAEENVSAFSGNRGPELEAALAAAVAAGGELWVFHSSRLARGSGRLAEGRSLMKLFSDLLARGVQLRSVEDDAFLTNPMLVGVASEMAHKYSADLSAHVRRGKRAKLNAAVESGSASKWIGGLCPDGYERVEFINAQGRADSRYEVDEGRAPIIRRIFEMRAEGHNTTSIAMALNRAGHRTRPRRVRVQGTNDFAEKPGIEFQQRRIRETLANPFYAGRVVVHRNGAEEDRLTARGGWEPLVDPEAFDRLQEIPIPPARAGRPPTRGGVLALHKLGRCNRCGRDMRSASNAYVRKSDGNRSRRYLCVAHQYGACDAPPIDASRVDAALVEHVNRLFIDVEAWQADLARGADEVRGHAEAALASARRELKKAEQTTAQLGERYNQQTDPDKADAVLDLLVLAREAKLSAEGSVRGAATALAAVPDGPPTDEILDVYTELARILRDGDASTLNERLALVFSHVEMDTMPDRTIALLPVFRNDLIERFADPSGVLRVITAAGMTALDGSGAPPSAGLVLVGADQNPATRRNVPHQSSQANMGLHA